MSLDHDDKIKLKPWVITTLCAIIGLSLTMLGTLVKLTWSTADTLNGIDRRLEKLEDDGWGRERHASWAYDLEKANANLKVPNPRAY